MSTPVELFYSRMHKYQQQLFGAFDYRAKRLKRRTPQFFHLEWHRRARKTTAAVNLLIAEACRIPRAKYVYVAPSYVMSRNIVWDDPNMLRSYLPDKREIDYKLNEQKMLITFANGSMLKFGGADEPDSLRGIDAVGVVFDEWSLIKQQTWTEIFRPIIAGDLPPQLDDYLVYRWSMFLYTPKGSNHATETFDNACCLNLGGELPVCGEAIKMQANTYASRLDGELSGILSAGELKRMQEEVARGEIPQSFYDQEIRCSRITQEEMTLITTEMLHRLNEYHTHTRLSVNDEVRKIVSIDPAWGGDVCEIMGVVNCRIECNESLLDRHNTSEICLAAKQVAKTIGTKNFIVDVVNARGIADTLAGDDAGYNVQYFHSSESPSEHRDSKDTIVYANRRAEAYAYTAQQVRRFGVGQIEDRELLRQLPVASRYKTQGGSGKLILIPKQKIKQDLKRSPDKADCFVMGVYGSRNVPVERGGRVIVGGIRAMVPEGYSLGIGI